MLIFSYLFVMYTPFTVLGQVTVPSLISFSSLCRPVCDKKIIFCLVGFELYSPERAKNGKKNGENCFVIPCL